MIKCSFCSNTKASKYLFTQCSHLICINCASLRVNQGVKCCNKMTHITSEVKQELMKKKVQILRNLQNSYEEEDNEHQGYQIQHESKANQKKENHTECYREAIYEKSQQNSINFMESTPIDKFYPAENPKHKNDRKNNQQIFQMSQYVVQAKNYKKNYQSYCDEPQSQRRNSPISKVQSNSKQNKQKSLEKDINDFFKESQKVASPIKFLQEQNRNNIDEILHLNEKSLKKEQIDKNLNNSIKNYELEEILQRKTQQVREQFRLLKNELNKKQEQILANLQKVYVKNIVDMNISEDKTTNELLQRQRMTLTLQQVLRQYSFKSLRERIIAKDQKHKQKHIFLPSSSSYVKSDYKNLHNENLFQQANHKNLQHFKPDYKNLGFHNHSNSILQQNSYLSPKKSQIQNPLSIRSPNLKPIKQNSSSKSNKQLQKIYKKLDQSRSKLQERIQKHNMFLSQRYRSEFV